MVTMVERQTAFMMMEKPEHGKNAQELTKVVTRMLMAFSYSKKRVNHPQRVYTLFVKSLIIIQ